MGRQPSDIAVGDLNGDGNPDLITANSGSDYVSVLLGAGDGTFTRAPGPNPAAPHPHLIVSGDFNRDGHLDIATTTHHSNAVSVLLGDGRGRFRPAPGSPFQGLQATPPHNHGLAAGDVNGDGSLDLLTVNQNHNNVSVLLGTGDGGFHPAGGSPFPVGRMPYLPALADLDEDGHLDIVVPNAHDNSLAVLIGNGHGGFSPAAGSPFPAGRFPYFVVLGDLDNDAHLDAVTTHGESNRVTILRGDGKGGFSPRAQTLTLTQRCWKVHLVDLNRDGNLDLVASGNGNAVSVLLGDGAGGFTPAPGSPFAAGPGPWGLAVADVNGDGRADLITANSDGNDVSVLLARE